MLPIAAEADCQNCHADPIDCNDPALPVDSRTTACLGAAIGGNFTVVTLDDNPPGANRLEQLRSAAKINILRLHDAKHGADYKNWDASGNLVAATCDPQSNPNSANCIANQTPIQMLPQVATINSSPGSRFAENQAVNQKGQTVDVLYRLSKGHGGVMCEGCHGSTHAIYPNPNPLANDNVASNQLQGHRGSITECKTCHTTDLGITLGGPHGMHPVGGTSFTNGGHEDLAENNPDACRTCHGQNGQGTVLSKVAATRHFILKECEDGSLCPGGK